MKKNYSNNIFSLLFLLLLFVSCKNPLQNNGKEDKKSAKVFLQISLGFENSRLASVSSEEELKLYKSLIYDFTAIKLQSDDSNNSNNTIEKNDLTYSQLINSSFEVETGVWEFALYGYYGDSKDSTVLYSIIEKQEISEENKSVVFEMQPSADTYGTALIKFYYGSSYVKYEDGKPVYPYFSISVLDNQMDDSVSYLVQLVDAGKKSPDGLNYNTYSVSLPVNKYNFIAEYGEQNSENYEFIGHELVYISPVLTTNVDFYAGQKVVIKKNQWSSEKYNYSISYDFRDLFENFSGKLKNDYKVSVNISGKALDDFSGELDFIVGGLDSSNNYTNVGQVSKTVDFKKDEFFNEACEITIENISADNNNTAYVLNLNYEKDVFDDELTLDCFDLVVTLLTDTGDVPEENPEVIIDTTALKLENCDEGIKVSVTKPKEDNFNWTWAKISVNDGNIEYDLNKVVDRLNRNETITFVYPYTVEDEEFVFCLERENKKSQNSIVCHTTKEAPDLTNFYKLELSSCEIDNGRYIKIDNFNDFSPEVFSDYENVQLYFKLYSGLRDFTNTEWVYERFVDITSEKDNFYKDLVSDGQFNIFDSKYYWDDLDQLNSNLSKRKTFWYEIGYYFFDGDADTNGRFQTKVVQSEEYEYKPREAEPEACQVTFNTDGGRLETDGGWLAPVNVKEGECISEPEVELIKDHYDFIGWYYDDGTGMKEYDFSTPVTKSFQLTAMWKIYTFTVVFMDGENVFDEKTVAWNEKIPESEMKKLSEKEGCTFLGWYYKDSQNNNESPFSFDQTVTEDMTLYAKWRNPIEEVGITYKDENPIFAIKVSLLTDDSGNEIVTLTAESENEKITQYKWNKNNNLITEGVSDNKLTIAYKDMEYQTITCDACDSEETVLDQATIIIKNK